MPVDQLTRPDGTAVQVALRPEKFALSTQAAESPTAVSGRLNTSANLGERSPHYIKIEGREDPVPVSSPNLVARAGEGQAAGTPGWLTFDPASIVVLDAD